MEWKFLRIHLDNSETDNRFKKVRKCFNAKGRFYNLIITKDNDKSSELEEKCERHESEVEKLINEQNPDGSWDSSTKINNELVKKYNQKVAATIASIAIIRKNSGPALNSFKLIIKKALNFLQKFDSSVDWESIIDEEITKI